jgi:hypothetical protein
MTQTSQIRARYAGIFAAGMLTLAAATFASTAWTQAPTAASQAAMDVNVIMTGIDAGSLPMQGHIDAI